MRWTISFFPWRLCSHVSRIAAKLAESFAWSARNNLLKQIVIGDNLFLPHYASNSSAMSSSSFTSRFARSNSANMLLTNKIHIPM